MMWKPAVVSLCLLAAVACNRRAATPTPAAPAANAPAAVTADPPAAPTPAAPRARGEALEIVSGRSIGAVHLGMTTAELRALGTLQESSRRGDEAFYTLAPLTLTVRGDRVTRIALTIDSHPAGARIGTTLIAPTTPTEAVLALLPGCGPLELTRGGANAVCDQGRTRVMRVGPPAALALEVLTP